MKVVQKIIVMILLGFFAFGGQAVAFQAELIGFIQSGLSAPTSIAVGTDYLAVLEPFADRITLFTVDGRISHRVDFTGEGIGLARLDDNQYLYCDRRGKTVIIVDLEQGTQNIFLDQPDLLTAPVDVIVEDSQCFILDAGSGNVLITDLAGRPDRQFALIVPGELEIGFPSSFAYDRNQMIFYIFDQINSRVLAFNRQGEFSGSFCSFGAEAGTVTRGGEIACDNEGYVYITDRYQGRVVVFNRKGDFLGNIDPSIQERQGWNIPTGIAVDDQGLLYIASTEGRRVDIYHLEKGGYSDGLLAASPVYPGNYDTVAVDDIRLIAGLRGVSEVEEVEGVDFRLVSWGDTTAILGQVLDIQPTDGSEDDTESPEITAMWRPDIALTPRELYGWQVRVHVGDQRGAWSSWQWFRTAAVPLEFSLAQNYPNPFNPRTTLSFVVGTKTDATVTIFNLLGREVCRTTLFGLTPGRHEIEWNGLDNGGNPVGSGVYFYRLTAGVFSQTRKMVLLK